MLPQPWVAQYNKKRLHECMNAFVLIGCKLSLCFIPGSLKIDMATKKKKICFEYTCWIFSGVVELFVCVEGPLRFFLGNIFSPASFFMVGLAV